MLLNVLAAPLAPPKSVIDVATIQADFKPGVLGTHYSLNAEGTELTKIGADSNSSRCFEVTGKARPGGKYFMRFKRNGPLGSAYITVLFSSGLVTANNQVGWTTPQYVPDVWHEVKIEHVSGNIYRFLIDNVQVYQGTASNMSFYGHTSVTKMEIDCGQSEIAPPAGYSWL